MLSTTLLLAASMVVGQADGPSINPKLEGLKPLIGHWRHEGLLHDDLPGVAEKGSQVVATSSFRWILRGQAIELTWQTRIDGKLTVSGKALVGWDGTCNKIMEWAVTNQGNHSGEWKKQDDAWVYSLSGFGPKGKTSVTCIYTEMEPNSFTFEAKDRVFGDETEPDSAKYVFERVEGPRRKGRKQ